MSLSLHFWTILGIWWVSGILDYFSTVWCLEEDPEAEEWSRLPRTLHSKFGLRRGQLINFSLWVLVISPLIAYYMPEFGGLNFSYLFAGAVFGVVFKQLLNGYDLKFKEHNV